MTKHSSSQNPTEEVFSVGVKEPILLRKEILSCGKDVLGILKRHETFKEIRKEKADTSLELKRIFDEINTLSGRLRQALPKAKLRALSREVEERPQGRQPARATSEMDKLEQELAFLESKLQRLK